MTRRICNDPRCCGVEYTSGLRDVCAELLQKQSDRFGLTERETVVVNILRGGLNFGLREALASAYGWKGTATCFLSAQRTQDTGGNWHVSETAYKKVYLPKRASLVVGDVVGTGTSLRYALPELIEYASAQQVDLRRIVLFTIGTSKAREIMTEIDGNCRARFPDYQGTTLVYFEGEFAMAEETTPLSVRIPGTDLLRLGATMAPEFIDSQYENPAYPIERCAIYDAGSRAFWLPEYVQDVIGYWRKNLELAKAGMTYRELLAERFPSLDAARFPSDVDLASLARHQIAIMEDILR